MSAGDRSVTLPCGCCARSSLGRVVITWSACYWHHVGEEIAGFAPGLATCESPATRSTSRLAAKGDCTKEAPHGSERRDGNPVAEWGITLALAERESRRR